MDELLERIGIFENNVDDFISLIMLGYDKDLHNQLIEEGKMLMESINNGGYSVEERMIAIGLMECIVEFAAENQLFLKK